MKIGKSVVKAIDEMERGDMESAMLHACNAIDGTAKRVYPSIVSSNVRFTRLLRDNYDIFGPMAMPGINLHETRWPVTVNRPKASGGKADIADVIYGVHRCTHGHGEALPEGFELTSDSKSPNQITTIYVEKGKIRLSDRTIFGLLAVVVLPDVDMKEEIPDSYFLTFDGIEKLSINEWWGRKSDFLLLTAKVNMPSVKLDFKEWMEDDAS